MSFLSAILISLTTGVCAVGALEVVYPDNALFCCGDKCSCTKCAGTGFPCGCDCGCGITEDDNDDHDDNNCGC